SADDPADTAYDFVIDGEVLRGEELFENFRYRYRLPAGSAAEGKVPVLFERLLRPGDWRLVVRLEDREGGSFFRSEIPLEVPARAAAIVDTTQATGTGAAAPAGLGPP